MNPIEYRPEIERLKPGDKIDLDNLPSNRFEKRGLKSEAYWPALKAELAGLAKRLNSVYGPVCTEGGQIKMGGPDWAQDNRLVEERQAEWSAELGKSRETFLADREKNPAALAEAATTLLFDKILRRDFVIVRAAEYDDYVNGADQLIIDKQTGAVICGVDDVLGHEGDDGGEKKEKKIDAKMRRGGAAIKYGATVRGGQLERQALFNIPLFYFSLSKEELINILPALTGGADKISPAERAVYKKLFESLEAQADKYAADFNLDPRLQANLRRLRPSLEIMRAATAPAVIDR